MLFRSNEDDGRSVRFETGPLSRRLELFGTPEVILDLASDVKQANIAVRLSDVAPDGAATRITYGILNLSHRGGHARPEPMVPGRRTRVRVRLNDLGQAIPKGHRLRLAIQNQFWFVLWPQPELSMLTVPSGKSVLRLPVRPPSPRDGQVRFAPPEISPSLAVEELRPAVHAKTVSDDLATGIRTIAMATDFGAWRISDRAIESSARSGETFTIAPDEPLSAKLVSEYAWTYRSGEADVAGSSRTELTADAQDFILTWRVEAREKEKPVFEASATRRIRRDYC